jgi:hypothetical protein
MDETSGDELGGHPSPDEVIKSLLASSLAPGETVVWSGRPQPGSIARRALPKALFGLAFVAFTLFWMAGVVSGKGNNWDKGKIVAPFASHNVAIAALAGLWMLPPGFYMLSWPLWAWRRARRTLYALTDRRAIVLEVGSRGRHRTSSFTTETVALMQCDEHGEGKGDLLFQNRKTWVSQSEAVGFLGIERVREVEALVRKTLSVARDAATTANANDAGPPVEERRYRIGGSFRLCQAIALTLGGISAFCLIGNLLVALVAVALLREKVPAAIASLVADAGWHGPAGVGVGLAAGVGSLAALGFFAWMSFQMAFGTPTEIIVNEAGEVEFRSRLRTIVLRACDMTSVVTGVWPDMNSFQVVIRHKAGKVFLVNQFPEFRDFLASLKALNPAIEVRGF